MVKEIQHFTKAPIVEAIVGIDLVELLGNDSLPTLKSLGEQLQPEYPSTEDIFMGQVKFDLGSGSQSKQENTHLGYFFKSSDRLQVVQARQNGFGFSRLAPYQDWNQFISEAKRIWALYRHAIGPTKIGKWDDSVHQ